MHNLFESSESKEVTEAFGAAGGESRCDLTRCVFVTSLSNSA